MKLNKLSKIAIILCMCALTGNVKAHATEVSDFSELHTALENATSTILIKNDIQVTDSTTVKALTTKTMSSLSGNYTLYSDGVDHTAINISNASTLTINNVSFKDFNNTNTSNGGVFYAKGVSSEFTQRYSVLNLSGNTFKSNKSASGGVILVGNQSIINMTGATFEGNSTTSGDGGVIASNMVTQSNSGNSVHIANSTFVNNSATGNGGAISLGRDNKDYTSLTILNSEFNYNSSLGKGGAIYFDGDATNYNAALTIIANEGNTTFRKNTSSLGSDGIYLDNFDTGHVYINAGNNGIVQFDDSIRVNDFYSNSFIDLNAPNVTYASYEKLAKNGSALNDTVAPTDGKIIFNDEVYNANLRLFNGTLSIGDDPSVLAGLAKTEYFSNSALTLYGGTLDLLNGSIESGTKLSLNDLKLNGNSNLEFDVNLTSNTNDYLNLSNPMSGSTGSTLTIDSLGISGDQSLSLGNSHTYQFISQNGGLGVNAADISLSDYLTTVITSKAGYQLELASSNSSSTGYDSLKITNLLSKGGLPVAVSIGGKITYEMTDNEILSTWNTPYLTYSNALSQVTDRVLKDSLLYIKGNGKTITGNGSLYGIAMTTGQTLSIDNVSNWSKFKTVIDNTGGNLSVSNSTFSSNTADVIKNEIGTVNITNTIFQSNTSGSAIENLSGTVNVGSATTDTTVSFLNNQSNNLGGAIYNTSKMYFYGISDFGAISGSTVSNGNLAKYDGGAIYNNGANAVLAFNGDTNFYGNHAVNGGAIFNNGGFLTINGTLEFIKNYAQNNGGAIANTGDFSISTLTASDTAIFNGNYTTSGNNSFGGGAIKSTGTLTIEGIRTGDISTANTANIRFINNYVPSSASDGGAIHVEGTDATNRARLNLTGADFSGNYAYRGGAIRGGNNVILNINDSQFIGNYSTAFGGALSTTTSSDIHIANSYFEGNNSVRSGGAITNGTSLTILNSTFLNNYAVGKDSKFVGGGAVTYNGNATLKILANGADTYFSGNYSKSSSSATAQSDGLCIYEVLANSPKLYMNAGNGGSIIFDDAVAIKGAGGHVDLVNDYDINLNSAINYSSYDNLKTSTTEDVSAPTDGTIIFNNQITGANLILNGGTLSIGETQVDSGGNKLLAAGKSYFVNSGVMLKGGTFDVLNKTIQNTEASNNQLTLANFGVSGNNYLQMDIDLANSKIDYLNLGTGYATGTAGNTLTINNLYMIGSQSGSLGDYITYQFLSQNGTSSSDAINFALTSNLKTVITSNAGYSISLAKSNASSGGNDSLKITHLTSDGGLPIAVSIGQYGDYQDVTYVYNAITDEIIDNWGKKYYVYGVSGEQTASNVLMGNTLVINGNGKTFSTTTGLEGILMGSYMGTKQELTISNATVSGFKDAFSNDGGKLTVKDVSFNGNTNGILNKSDGIVNITDSNFTNNTGAAIINENSAGVVNINASNNKNIVFSGNGTDIKANGGNINLTSGDTESSITFNGKITGTDLSQMANVNILGGTINLTSTATVDYSNVTLNTGKLSVGVGAEEGSHNYFSNSDLTLNGGTLDLQNKYIDTINLNNLTINSTPDITLDVSLDGNNMSDKLNVTNLITDNGKLNISKINLTGTSATKVVSLFVNQSIASSLESAYSTITYNDVAYFVSVNNNVLTISIQDATSGYADAVADPVNDERTYQIGATDEYVVKWMGDISNPNKLSGSVFNVTGGNDGRSIIGQGIIGVNVGTNSLGVPQQFIMNGVSGYKQFNSALINNGGSISISDSTLSENHATTLSGLKDANGGAIQNNSGTVTIGAKTIFSNNKADVYGGAIYNAGTLVLHPSSDGDILFDGNTATISGNDIYQASTGVMNIIGTTVGSVTFNDGISGVAGSVIENTSVATVNLNGDNSNYYGSYSQDTGTSTLNVNSGAKFFEGTSTIYSGILNWYTANDLDYTINTPPSLTLQGGNLVVGNRTDNAVLTLKGDDTISNAGAITINNNAIFNLKGTNTITNVITGVGTLNLDGTSDTTKLVMNSGSDFGSSLNFKSNNSTLSVISNSTNVDNILTRVVSGDNTALNLVLDGTNASKDLTIDNTKITNLDFINDVTYSGNLTLDNGVVSNNGNLTLDTNSSVSGTSGTFNNSGTDSVVTVNGNASGYSGDYIQNGTSAQTIANINASGSLFGGDKYINSGSLTVNSDNQIDYQNVLLGSNTTYTHTANTANVNIINSDVFSFQTGATGVKVDLSASNNVLGNSTYYLTSKIDNNTLNANNQISFNDSILRLDIKDFTGTTNSTNYILNNSTLDLSQSVAGINNYKFSNLSTTGTTNKLAINAEIIQSGSSFILNTDTINTGSGSSDFSLGKLVLTGTEHGLSSYNTVNNVIQTSNSKIAISGDPTVVRLGTTAYEYKVICPTDKTIGLEATKASDEHTLYIMNGAVDGTRYFQFSIGGINEYHIDQSLSATLAGDFYVTGQDKDVSKSVLSGILYDKTTHQPLSPEQKGSFFNIASGTTTNLEISDLTIQDAQKTGNGSVLENNDANSTVVMDNVAIQNNSATGTGGAIYNAGTLTVKNTKNDSNGNNLTSLFKNNTSTDNGGAIYNTGTLTVANTRFTDNASVNSGVAGKGGAIYNTGTMNLENVIADAAKSSTVLNDIYQDGGTTNLTGTNILNSNIGGTGSITNSGILTLGGDNSGYTGTYEQTSGSTTVNGNFFGGNSTIDAGTLNWYSTNDIPSTATLNVTSGNLNIGNANVNSTLTLNSGSSVAKEVTTNLDKNSKLILNGGSTTFDGATGDTWSGQVNVVSGDLTINNISSNGQLVADGGNINLESGNLNIASGSIISSNATTTVAGNLNITGGDVTLDSATSDSWSGNVNLSNGNLTLDGLTSNGKLTATGGNLDVKSGDLAIENGSSIGLDTILNVENGSNISINDNGSVAINDGDIWTGTISMDSATGTLNYGITNSNMSGTLIADKGNLNLLAGSVLNIQTPSAVSNAVSVDVQKNSTVNINSGAQFVLDSATNDKWNGLITNNGGTFITDNLSNSTSSGGSFQQESGSVVFQNNSNIEINSSDSYIKGGNLTIGDSKLNWGSSVSTPLTVDNLTMYKSSTMNLLNGNTENVTVNNTMNVNGINNVSIDLNLRNKVGDSFVINNLISDSNGTLNISDYNFVGGCPLDKEVSFKVFNASNISDVNFTSTDKGIFTPVGNYKLSSQGGGSYLASLTSYNPQVYRGQVATMAMYNNQLNIDDILLNHVGLTSERTVANGQYANQYASVNPLFAPYQYTKEEGGLWYKAYVDFETLTMTRNLSVHNTAYGSLVGADFPMMDLKHGWKFIPTAYVGYNGANQSFNNVSMYQNGGQGGLVGTWMKNDFIGSMTAYAGGYSNEMSVAGTTDKTGNWFAGTAAKLAYNFHVSKCFTIQPTAFISYNIFGKQHWNSDYGVIGMNSGLLNGINVAPGVNFIYSRKTWSVYTTLQYMYNINDRVNGGAGNIDLQSVSMRHGYIQYGIGATKTWKDRLNSYAQVVIRNGGRTGVGFQLGAQYLFDFNLPSKQKSSSTGVATQVTKKTVIKSMTEAQKAALMR